MNQENNFEIKKVVSRFAPSPTGFLHIGGARTALFNYLFTKQKNGKTILRIEDTDTKRNKSEYTEGIYDIFNWLDLKFDETKLQSDNFNIHKKYLEKLIANNNAYISKEEVLEEGQRGEVIRFKNPNKIISFKDLIRGEVKVDTADLGDFIIAKSLHEPIFHLSNVVDDIIMGVNTVIRAEEHIANTPRQILIWEAINERERPLYAHIPLILNENREKLSKRKHGEKASVEYYKNNGYLKDAFINYIAFVGWNPGGEREIYSIEELIEKFNIEKMQKGGAVFNVEKLNWYNKEYIKLQNKEDQLEMIQKFLPNYDKEFLSRVQNLLIERISFYGELKTLDELGDIKYLQNNFDYNIDLTKLAWKKSDINEAREVLKSILNYFNEQEKIDEIISKIKFLSEEKGNGNVLWPLRFTLSGREKSPDPVTLINIFGIEESKRRIEKVLSLI